MFLFIPDFIYQFNGVLKMNESRGAAPSVRTKALILLSRRVIALLESKFKEKEQDMCSLGALIA